MVLSGTAPAAPALDTDYTLNPSTAILTFLTACTGVKAAYSYAAHSLVTVFSNRSPNMYVLFDGENTVDGAVGLARGEVYKIGVFAGGHARFHPGRLRQPGTDRQGAFRHHAGQQ
ncbi:hypothetical protein RLIN73S_06113 [Rhodanobacter lindaniclasticus]